MSGDQPVISAAYDATPAVETPIAAQSPDVAAPALVRALVEVAERHGNVVARYPVRHWPVRVGRALDNDIVLDDVHVAPRHLMLEQIALGRVRVHVQDTMNGVAQGRQTHGRGTRFDWQPGQVLNLGRQHLRLRLAETTLAPEQELPGGSQHGFMLTLLAVAAMLVQMVAQLWLRGTGADGNWQEVPQILVGGLGALVVWAGLWAMVSRVISHHAQFRRHVSIASTVLVVAFIAEFALQALAFAFSLEMVARFTNLALVLFVAYGIYRHLLVAAPHARRAVVIGMLLVLVVGLPTSLGTQWLKNRRLSNQLYMATFFPPSWRVAAPVATEQFLKEAATLEQRVQARLEAGEDEGEGDAGEDDGE